MRNDQRILIACIGNIFLGDDGFACEVARRLASRPLPASVHLIDFGIRGFDLGYALLDGYEATILVDATPRGGEPGTVYTIEPELSGLDEAMTGEMIADPHDMHPLHALRMARSMGGRFQRILLVGCEPQLTAESDGQMGLSAPVEAAVDRAVAIVERLVRDLISEAASGVGVPESSTEGDQTNDYYDSVEKEEVEWNAVEDTGRGRNRPDRNRDCR